MKLRKIRDKEGVRKGIYLLPNLCTTGSLFCGFYSVIKSWSGEFTIAAWAILLAGVFDLLDGRIARLTGAESQFGVEYDSLVDLASFGLAPGILMYTWSLYSLPKFGWLVSFLFFACGALRLARYNVQHDNLESLDFEGLPIPVAAYFLATYVIFYNHGHPFAPDRSWLVLAMMLALSLLMVSTIRYRSLKVFDLKSKSSFFALVLLVVAIFVVAIKPEISLFLSVAVYVLSGAIEEMITLKKSRQFVSKFRKKGEVKEEVVP